MTKSDDNTYKWMTGIIQDKWLTSDIQQKLRAIKNPHVAKKRVTIIRLAFAHAMQVPVREVFSQKDVCNEATWYTKWQYEPEIKAAYDVCCRRALDWVDEELAAQEEYYRRERRRSIAKWSAQAPYALAVVMVDSSEKGGDRISAANSLLTWADPEAAGKAQPASPPSNSETTNIGLLANLTGDELDKLINNTEAAARYAEARAAAPDQLDGEARGEGPGPADLDDDPAADDRPQDKD